jgi:hypothetical protein
MPTPRPAQRRSTPPNRANPQPPRGPPPLPGIAQRAAGGAQSHRPRTPSPTRAPTDPASPHRSRPHTRASAQHRADPLFVYEHPFPHAREFSSAHPAFDAIEPNPLTTATPPGSPALPHRSRPSHPRERTQQAVTLFVYEHPSISRARCSPHHRAGRATAPAPATRARFSFSRPAAPASPLPAPPMPRRRGRAARRSRPRDRLVTGFARASASLRAASPAARGPRSPGATPR